MRGKWRFLPRIWTGTDLTVTILTALGTLVGALIGASAIKARQVTQE